MTAVTLGIDRFLQDHELKKKKLGLISNPTGNRSSGEPGWQALMREGFKLKALFGPEHGFCGHAQDAVKLGDAKFHGIPLYSLYGERLSPDPEVLRSLDVLLFDIQDMGCRYYTYLYTLALAMEACEKTNTQLIVADRPNPIVGKAVEGHPIEPAFDSFVGGYGLPIITGLTIGEFALYLQDKFFPETALRVIPMENYHRQHFEDCGLLWHLPSPNIPTLHTALVYPGTCLFEGTNLSEGRGTTRPFEMIGAPFIEGEKLRQVLSEENLPGTVFTSVFFTPSFSKWKGKQCEGLLLHVVEPEIFSPLRTGIAMLRCIRQLYPDKLEWRNEWENEEKFFFDSLAGGETLRISLQEGKSLDAIMEEMNRGCKEFRKDTLSYHLYR